MITFIASVFVFCLLIFIHEFGHFIAAKAVGVTVHEFAIGMGPKIISWQGKETKYSIRILPIGGYVKLEGEDEDSQSENALCNKAPWKRFIVLFAGAFMNLLLGFLLFIILVFNSTIRTSTVDTVVKGSAFEQAGIQPGYEIIRMAGEEYSSDISSYNDITYFEYKNGFKDGVNITFDTGNGTVTKYIEKKEIPGEDGTQGRKIYGFTPGIADKNAGTVIVAAVDDFTFMTKMIFASFIDLFTGKVPADAVSGPVGIVNEIGNAADTGFLSLLALLAMLSVNLGIMNLLPIPALDGGRILFVLIEMIFRKPVPRDKEAWIHFIGFALLIALILVVTFNDVRKLIGL